MSINPAGSEVLTSPLFGCRGPGAGKRVLGDLPEVKGKQETNGDIEPLVI